MTIKAVIFDMDGVLVDAKEWHYEALNRALGHFGLAISRYDHLITYDGLPTRKKLDLLSKERNLPRALHGFLNDLKQQYTVELVHARCRPTFQHEYALSRLKAEGLKLAVASNAVRASVELMMERTRLAPYLDVILSNTDVVNSKPDPEIYLTAASRLGLSPQECLVVEDNPHGIQAARSAGTHVMTIHTVTDVTLDAISASIRQVDMSMVAA